MQERHSIIGEFRSGSSRVLVTTDYGLNSLVTTDSLVSNTSLQCPLVINYDLPTNRESYLSRLHAA